MSDIAIGAVVSNAAQTQSKLSIQMLKRRLDDQKAVVGLVEQAVNSGNQLNASGRGQIVNTYA